MKLRMKNLKKWLKKPNQLKIPVNQLISNYINRGLMIDGCNEDTFNELHCEEFLTEVNEALDVD